MIGRIESEDNFRIKLIKKLSSKKHRDALSKFVIEGINLVQEALDKKVELDFILISEDYEDNINFDRLDLSGLSNVFVTSSKLFEKIADAGFGSGVIAVANRRKFSFKDLAALSPKDNILIFDRLQDPGNIGTMIRTSVAAGYRAIVVLKGTADIFSPKVTRATAGMIFDIPIIYYDNPKDLADDLGKIGKRICVTVPSSGVPYYDTDLSRGIALVIGNEGNGISDELISLADELVTIPMRGDVESLNAAISAAILMYEAVRK